MIKKMLLISAVGFFLLNNSNAQKTIATLDYSSFDEWFTPKNFLSKLNYLFSVGKEEKIIKTYSLNLTNNQLDSSIFVVPDTLNFSELNFFTDSCYVEFFTSKANKKNSYLWKYNFVSKNSVLIYFSKGEKEDKTFVKSAQNDNKLYKLFVDKKSDLITFLTEDTSQNITTAYDVKKVVKTFNISEGKLYDLMVENKMYVFNDVAYFINDFEKKSFEFVWFNLKSKEFNYSKIKRSQDVCDKEPNGIFYNDASFCNGKIFSTICCRHNVNLFIYNANSGAELKHYALNLKSDTTLNNSILYLEHFKDGAIETISNKSKFFTNIDTHPLLIDAYTENGQDIILNFGTRQKEKVINVETVLTLAAVTLVGVELFGLSKAFYSMFNNATLLSSNPFYPRFYSYNPDITTAKYFSFIIDNNTLNPALSKLNNYHQFKLSNRPFSDKRKDIISFKINNINYDIKFENNDRNLKILKN